MNTTEINRLLDEHMYLLETPNVVRIDYGRKVVGGRRTERPALVVGVIRKLPASALAAPDLCVPPVVTFHGADGPVELETDVEEEGEIRTIAVPGGTLIQTEGLPFGGSLGVNIQWQGSYRLLSCAHVLTGFDPTVVGAMVNYCDQEWTNPRPLRPVAGMQPVTYYPTQNVVNPVRNTYDFAWANVNPTIAEPAITQIGVPAGIRAAQLNETVRVYGGYSESLENGYVNSVTSRTTARSQYSDGTFVYSFWENSLQLNEVSLLPGDSGSAVVATADQRVVGIAFSMSMLYTYACPIP